jgi:hypothetical protein
MCEWPTNFTALFICLLFLFNLVQAMTNKCFLMKHSSLLELLECLSLNGDNSTEKALLL